MVTHEYEAAAERELGSHAMEPGCPARTNQRHWSRT